MASIILAAGQRNARAAAGWGRALLEQERRQLPLFIPVALGIGIALWFLLPLNAGRQAAALGALALAILGLSFRETMRIVFIAGGLLVLLGIAAAEYRSASTAAPRLYHWLSAAPVTGTIEEIRPRAGGEAASILLLRDKSSVDPAIRVRLNIAAAWAEGLAPGMRIRASASLGPIARPTLPGSYDPSMRAWFQSISASGRILSRPEVLPDSAVARPWFRKLRDRVGLYVARGIGGDEGAIASALTVGEQGRIAPRILQNMRVAGLAHILVVSGFHIGLVVGGCFFLLRRLLALFPALALRFSVAIAAALGAGLAGTAYVLLSGAGLPAIRSIIAAWMVLVAMMLGRDPLGPRFLALAAFLILLFRPESLFNPSFQLSFAAVTALIALAHSAPGRWLLPKPGDGVRHKTAKFVLGLFATGLAVELTLAPIALAQFGRTGLYGAFANIAAIPLTAFLIMPLLAAWLLLAPLGLGGLVLWALRPAIAALAGIGATVARWPGASITMPAIPQAALLLILLGALVFLLLQHRLRFLGVPLLALGAMLALGASRPDLFVGADARQVAIVRDGALHTLKGTRGGFLVTSWSEQANTIEARRIADLPGATCNALACRTTLAGGRVLLAFFGEAPAGEALRAACAAADIVTAPVGLPQSCAPRWLRLDPPALQPLGAVAIDSSRARIASVGAEAGDHPWSPASSPGMAPSLLGKPRWTGVVVE